nr:multiprotein-bridging factor 1c [Quercus suber]
MGTKEAGHTSTASSEGERDKPHKFPPSPLIAHSSVQKWKQPDHGLVKINCDGARFAKENKAGIGVVIRNNEVWLEDVPFFTAYGHLVDEAKELAKDFSNFEFGHVLRQVALTQDWEPVELHKNKTKVQDRDRKVVNQALRTRAVVRTVKKAEVVSNKKAAPVVKAKKLEEAAEPAALDWVSTEVKQLIQKARLEKKMSQAELAKQINERP